MNISIVIPNYNGQNLLEKNLPHVALAIETYQQKAHHRVDIIVVDDHSTDDSVEVVEDFAKKNNRLNINVVKNEKNLGFSSTVNKGVELSKSDVVVLLNTDVVPEKEFLIPLLSHFDQKNVFAVGCMDKSLELGKVILRGRGIGRFENGFFVHARGEVTKTNTLWVSCGSGAFRRSIWDTLGGLNELYNPFYWEDIDISYRATKSGYTIKFEPKSLVIHEHEEGAIKKRFNEFEIKTIAYKNQFIFVWVNITDLDLQFFHIFWLPYHFLTALLRKDWPFFNGFFKAFILLPKIIQSSLRAQRMFVKSDKEVMAIFSE